MLNTNEINTFCLILTIVENSSLSDETPREQLEDENYYDESDVAQTHETFDDFNSAHGQPDESEEYFSHPTYIWYDVQKAKGKRRGTLVVTDFGHCRAARFDGEV